MNHKHLEAVRVEISSLDLLMIESWCREFGRSAAEGWLSLSEQQKAAIAAVIWGLARERDLNRKYWRLTKLQSERLKRRWSAHTVSLKMIAAGRGRTKREEVLGLEANPRKRVELDKPIVRTLEDIFDEPWESLMELERQEAIPVPRKSNTEILDEMQ